MGDPALKKENDPLAIEGLEDVFKTSEPPSEASELRSAKYDESSEEFRTSTDDASEVFGTAREILTTTEAAVRLGISSRAVLNRLKAGTLPGELVKGKFKNEWRVYWEPLPTPSEQSIFEDQDSSEDSEHQSEEQGRSFGSTSELSSAQHILSDLLSAHTQQINAQADLIRYLTEQLKDKDSQIKLLTDSQHQPRGAWSRFWSWFMGH